MNYSYVCNSSEGFGSLSTLSVELFNLFEVGGDIGRPLYSARLHMFVALSHHPRLNVMIPRVVQQNI